MTTHSLSPATTGSAPPLVSMPLMLFAGELIPYGEAKLHVLHTSGAPAVFEGVRAYWNERQEQLYGFRLEDHARRLRDSMKIARIPGPREVQAYVDDLVRALRANDVRENVYLRHHVLLHGGLTVQRVRPSAVGAAPEDPVVESIGVYPLDTFPMRRGPAGCHVEITPVHAAISSWTQLSDASMPPRLKHVANYHNSRLALVDAQEAGFDDAILLTADGKVTEGPLATVMMIRRGRLFTPPVAAGVLEGITRDTIMELAAEMGIPVVERPIDRSELYVADELFYCGTSKGLTPIASVDRVDVADGRIGETTTALLHRYLDAAIGEDVSHMDWLTPVFDKS